MNNILILGTKNYDFDLSTEFLKKGLICFFCGNEKSNMIPKDKWIDIDYTNTSSVIDFIEKNKGFKHVIPGSNDLAYLTVCKIMERSILNNTIRIDGLKSAENYLLKSNFRKQIIPKIVYTPKIFDLNNIEKSNYPVVLKQDKMSGGKGVKFFNDEISFKNFQKKQFIKEKFIIEEYIEGSGHGVSYFVKNNKIIFEFYDNEYYCKDKLAVVATSTPTNLNFEQKQKIKRFCLEYFQNYKLVDGIFHIQCIKKEERIYIIECTRRLPGDYYHEFSSLSLQNSYLKFYIASFISNNEELPTTNKVKKNIVRIVSDELIDYNIQKNDNLKYIIKKNLIKKKSLDGYRISENNQKYLKKEAIFLEFSDSLDANIFCQDLVKDL